MVFRLSTAGTTPSAFGHLPKIRRAPVGFWRRLGGVGNILSFSSSTNIAGQSHLSTLKTSLCIHFPPSIYDLRLEAVITPRTKSLSGIPFRILMYLRHTHTIQLSQVLCPRECDNFRTILRRSYLQILAWSFRDGEYMYINNDFSV